jgi:hypothetical protein
LLHADDGDQTMPYAAFRDEPAPMAAARLADRCKASAVTYEPFLTPTGEPNVTATAALSRAVPDSRGLFALRRRINDASSAAGTLSVFAVLYGADLQAARAEDDLAAAHGLAASRTWQVRAFFTDVYTELAPAERPGWNRVRAAIHSGRAHGVVACCQAAVSRDTDLYRDELGWLESHRAALWLVQPETAS